jgi:hypothetical protein
MTAWIDRQGRVRYRSHSAATSAPDCESIAVRRDRRRSVEFRFHPSTVSERALLRAVDAMRDSRPGTQITLAALHGDEQKHTFNDPAAAIAMAMRLFADARHSRTARFLFKRLPAEHIAQDPGFGAILEVWRARRESASQRLTEVIRSSSQGRYLEVDPLDGASKLILRTIGEGYSLYGNGWKSGALGGRFEDMPDFAYARAAAEAYREAFRTNQPVFEEVTALVQMLRTGLLLLTYRRAILPVGDRPRRHRLLGATLDQRVRRLAFGTGDELGDVLQ